MVFEFSKEPSEPDILRQVLVEEQYHINYCLIVTTTDGSQLNTGRLNDTIISLLLVMKY